MLFSRHASTALVLAFSQQAYSQTETCQSFGVDFVDGGTYFQNSLSTAPFTAVQEFEGCQNDTSHNILVDPNGNQYECSMTPLLPSDTPETVTCPLDKDQLFTGEWSLLIISNNGDAAPIDYERDFSLIVGPQQTSTVTPTVTVSAVTTPIASTTSTITRIVTTVLAPSTVTVPLISLVPTVTIHPLPVITVVTDAVLTITSTSNIATVSTAVALTTATCELQERRLVADPLASIVATILGDLKPRDALPEPTAMPNSAKFKRAILEGRAIDEKLKARYLEERRARLSGPSLEKRAPDAITITVTDTNTADFSTITSTSTALTSTVVLTTTEIDTTTSTPKAVTVSKGVLASIATVTAVAQTLTNTLWMLATTVTATSTVPVTITSTITVTPAGLSASCSSAGGTLS